ncbi:hypothetical protein BSL78_22244 [Apostichopus japonicus]|uniref:Reverse transcriptase domain-containing protein n=1 Tax=Stichopus japonicus TaxID=307972 RepID=A0A2G8JYR4_STIJA|nr:hypothetical protein BSL78_22244 [Apostichopus japonicus]
MVLCIYCSPTKAFPHQFLNDISNSTKHIIITGDLNAKHTTLGCRSTNLAGKQLINLLSTSNLICLNTGEPTRYPSTDYGTPEQLDYFLISTNIYQLFHTLNTGKDLGSDHFPVILQLNTTTKKTVLQPRPNYKEADCSRHPPIRRFQLPRHIIHLIKQRRQLRKAFQRSKNADIKAKHNNMKKKITELIRKHKEDQYNNRSKQLSNNKDAKDFWKTVNKIFNIKSKHRNIPTLNYEGHAATTDQEKAETIRNYFSTVHSIPDKPQYNKNIYKLAHFIKRGYHSTYHPQEDVSDEEDQGHEEYTQEITPDDIRNILKHASNTSPGRDGIQYLHLKAAPPILLEALSMISQPHSRSDTFHKSGSQPPPSKGLRQNVARSEKLRKYNLPTKLTRWIASFLSHRTTNFKIGSSFSSPLHITTGTPQGSTISPILYIMYVGDIPQPENRFTQISQYADDIAIWTSHINPVRTEEYLQQYINSINQWCHDWRLELNPKKSQILYIAKHNRLRRQPYLTLNNTVIPVTNQVRFLGIHIDRGLTLGYQHRLTTEKLNNVLDYSSESPELQITLLHHQVQR